MTTEDPVARRNVLRSAGVAAGGLVVSGVALAPPATAEKHAPDRDVSGSWRVNVHNDDGSESISVLSFAASEVCVVHDISPAGPPFTGTWRSGAHDSFRATVLTGTPGDGPGSPGPVIELRLRGGTAPSGPRLVHLPSHGCNR